MALKRWMRRIIVTGCIVALVFVTARFWWRNSEVRAILVGQESRGKLVGIRMGLDAYYDVNERLPDQNSWKEIVMEMSVHEPGHPVFSSREALRNCFILTLKESPWTLDFVGDFSSLRKRLGDPAIAVCDPAGTIEGRCSATASLDDSGGLSIYDCNGTRIGRLPPDANIFALYLSGTIVSQKVRELGRNRDFNPVTDD